MSIKLAGLHKSIVEVWGRAELPHQFNKYWPDASRSEYSSLFDSEAVPTSPFPYCVYSADVPTVANRMSGVSTSRGRRETMRCPVAFTIYARVFDGVAKSAKRIASELCEEVIAVFGGHPTREPLAMTLDHGNVVQVTYQSDFGSKAGDDEYRWQVNYIFLLDVPVSL